MGPNRNKSVYHRLWCVYEIYLATKQIKRGIGNFSIRLPWMITPRQLLYVLPIILLLVIAGFFLGSHVLAQYIGSLFGPFLWLICSYTVFRVSTRLFRTAVLWLANEKKICEVTEIRLMIGWVYF